MHIVNVKDIDTHDVVESVWLWSCALVPVVSLLLLLQLSSPKVSRRTRCRRHRYLCVSDGSYPASNSLHRLTAFRRVGEDSLVTVIASVFPCHSPVRDVSDASNVTTGMYDHINTW